MGSLHTRPPSPLTVAGWELRRHLATRRSLLLGVVFAVFVGLILIKNTWQVPVSGSGHVTLTLYGATAYGQGQQVVGMLLLFFGVLLPFVATDAIAGDRHARVHEILMTTRLSTWAYVSGRYLAALVVGLVLAVVLLLADLVGNVLVGWSSHGYPSVDVSAALLLWGVFILPAMVVVTGCCFLLGTLLPLLATPIKVAALVAWVALSVIADIGHGLSWFGSWVPTGSGVLKQTPAALAASYQASAAQGASAPAAAMAAQNRLPDLHGFVGAHLGLVAIGLAAAVVAALGFDRFRRTLG